MKRAKFTSIAEADLREIAYYIARRNPERAMTFIDEIIAHCHKIANHPGIGRARSGLGRGIRSMPYGRYVIFYRVIDTGVEIRHVLHGARDIKAQF